MRNLKNLSLAVLVCGLGMALTAFGQTAVKVHKADLSINFGVAKGRLVAAGDLLVFVDDETAESSFAIERANIKGWNELEGILTIDTGKAVKDRSGERTRFAFRLIEGTGANLAAWYKESPSAKLTEDSSAATAMGTEAGQKMYQARKKNLIGSSDGKLIIAEKMIAFEAANDRARSRQWELKDIKNIKQTGPYVLEIEPFTGDDYKLELLGDGMPPAEFKILSDRVVAARMK
jgi:hypothetical protein